MRVSKLGNLFVAAVVALPLLVVACSDDPVVQPTPKPIQACPTTIAAAAGAACFDSAVTCDYPLKCNGDLDQQVRCPCNGSTFACEYRGEAVPKGPVPECKPSIGVDPPAVCPGNVAAAEGTACTSTGQICTVLAAKCADDTQLTDTCTCGSGEAGFIFGCTRKTCPGDGGVLPTPDAGRDSGDAGGD